MSTVKHKVLSTADLPTSARDRNVVRAGVVSEVAHPNIGMAEPMQRREWDLHR